MDKSLLATCLYTVTASYPDVSLSMKMCTQRKAVRDNGRDSCRLYPSHGPLRFITSRSPVPWEKQSTWGGGWYSDVVKEDPSPNWLRKCQEEDEEAMKKGKPRSRRFSFHKYFTTFFYLFFSSITLLYSFFFLYFVTHDINFNHDPRNLDSL